LAILSQKKQKQLDILHVLTTYLTR